MSVDLTVSSQWLKPSTPSCRRQSYVAVSQIGLRSTQIILCGLELRDDGHNGNHRVLNVRYNIAKNCARPFCLIRIQTKSFLDHLSAMWFEATVYSRRIFWILSLMRSYWLLIIHVFSDFIAVIYFDEDSIWRTVFGSIKYLSSPSFLV